MLCLFWLIALFHFFEKFILYINKNLHRMIHTNTFAHIFFPILETFQNGESEDLSWNIVLRPESPELIATSWGLGNPVRLLNFNFLTFSFHSGQQLIAYALLAQQQYKNTKNIRSFRRCVTTDQSSTASVLSSYQNTDVFYFRRCKNAIIFIY